MAPQLRSSKGRAVPPKKQSLRGISKPSLPLSIDANAHKGAAGLIGPPGVIRPRITQVHKGRRGESEPRGLRGAFGPQGTRRAVGLQEEEGLCAPNALIIPSDRFANLSNTEKWWLEYCQRPAPRRANSLPPSIRRPPRNQLRREPRSPFWSGVRKTGASFRACRQWVNAKVDVLYQAAVDAIRPALDFCSTRKKAIVFGALSVMYLTVNSKHHLNAPMPPAFARYGGNSATWLYADDANHILGLDPVLPGITLNIPAIKGGFRNFAKEWHPDVSPNRHGITNATFANQIMLYGSETKDIYLRHLAKPYCKDDNLWAAMTNLMNANPNIPHLKPGCVCNIGTGIKDFVKHAIIPYPYHSSPETDAELAKYCPCHISQGFSSEIDRYKPHKLPPALDRYYLNPQLRASWNPVHIMLTLRQRGVEQPFMWPEEEQAMWMEDGWAVKDDFEPYVTEKRACQMTEEEEREEYEARQEAFNEQLKTMFDDLKDEEQESGGE